jgi:3-hydroxyisobutyrate dehydrogenase-like beta-hydroxyacid dehydrogenase
MTQTIGFIGLGNMGLPMAKNLIAAGYHLQVHNRSMDKADELEQGSITRCNTPAQAASNVPVLITMLSDDDVVTEAVTGPEGILQTLQKNGLHISMSTISPDVSRKLAEQHAKAGTHYLASPVFGRPEAAAAKKLWICISGSAPDKATAQPILESLGQAIFDFGESADGANVVKIAGNFMIMSSLETMAEAFTLAEKHGLDRAKVAEFFGATIFNAPIYQNYGRLIAAKQYGPAAFKASLGYKDARLAFKLAQQSETPMPIGTVIHNRLLSAVARGWGERDWVEAVSRGVTEDAGL